MADTTDTESAEVTTDPEKLEWFRSSEQTGQTTISGLDDGPERLAFGEKVVTYSVVDGMPIFEGDILLDHIDLTEPGAGDAPTEPGPEDPTIVHSVALTGLRFRWPNGIVPFQFATGFPFRQQVEDAMDQITDNTMLQFVARTSANASEHPNFIEFFSGSGCFSSVGMRGNGRQRISMGPGCGTVGIAIHEILHALGMWHEQSREDRNNHVQVNLQNVIPGREHNFNQHIADGDDIGNYDFGSIMHYGRFAFSRNNQPTIVPNGGQAIGQRTAMSTGDIAGVNEIYPVVQVEGLCTIRQKSNGRFLDAHESGDRSAVTRTRQNNATQRWFINPVGVVATLRQVSNGRFLDAHVGSNDHSAVTRTRQNNDSQLWIISPHPTDLGRYWIQHLANGRFLDAHVGSNDHSVVTRGWQNNDTQAWNLMPVGGNRFQLRQVSTGRFLDAHVGSNDHSAVTRPAQDNDTQEWHITAKGFVCTIQQQSNMRFLDAHGSNNDHSAVTRARQDNATQRWVVMPSSSDSYAIRHASTGRFLDAHVGSNDHSAVTRPAQNNDTQRWFIESA